MGSLGANTAVSAITYKNIYTWSSNQMYMIKYVSQIRGLSLPNI